MFKSILPACVAMSLVLTACSAAAETQQRKGFLARLFAPQHQQSTPADGEAQISLARAEVKDAVEEAVENPPPGRIWCVPFARAVTGISLKGNARTWWKQAAGKYPRSDEPQVGAVINFSGSRAMPMGHVGVVSAVLSDREILVDHANWERNRVSLDNRVVDVSPNNDWSQVRVANSAGTLGRVNPVYGFIYTELTPRG